MRTGSILRAILIFFFLARQVRLLATLVTRNYLIAAILSDAVLFLVIFCYLTYSLGVHRDSRNDAVKTFVIALVAVTGLQCFFFLLTFESSDEGFFTALSPLRKIALPLALIFPFSYLLKSEFQRHGERVFKNLSRFFVTLLYIAVAYHAGEFLLRTISASFNTFYMGTYVAILENRTEFDNVQAADFGSDLLGRVFGVDVRRVYGIGLDMYTSGAIIFSCYLFHVFLSGQFRLFSKINLITLVALLLTGTKQFVLPYLVLNALWSIQAYYKKQVFMILMIVPAIVIVAAYILPSAFHEVDGYFTIFQNIWEPIFDNILLFLAGRGPMHMTLYHGRILVEELEGTYLGEIANVGWTMTVLEVGMLLTVLFVSFYLYIFKLKPEVIDETQLDYARGLKAIIAISLVVFLAHEPVLFDRTIVVFHVLFLSLLYGWLRYQRYQRSLALKSALKYARSGHPHIAQILPEQRSAGV